MKVYIPLILIVFIVLLMKELSNWNWIQIEKKEKTAIIFSNDLLEQQTARIYEWEWEAEIYIFSLYFCLYALDPLTSH